MWNTTTTPTTPAADPCDHRTQSAPVLIQTTRGGLYTARWTVYQDEEFESIWELEGREGLQLEASEVAAWQQIVPFVTES